MSWVRNFFVYFCVFFYFACLCPFFVFLSSYLPPSTRLVVSWVRIFCFVFCWCFFTLPTCLVFFVFFISLFAPFNKTGCELGAHFFVFCVWCSYTLPNCVLFFVFCIFLFAPCHKTGCELDGYFLLVLFSYFHLYLFLEWNSNGQFSCRYHWGHSGCQERTVSVASNIRPLLAGEHRLYLAGEYIIFHACDNNKKSSQASKLW